MPPTGPPTRYKGTPCTYTLPAGTVLHRVHGRDRLAAGFNPAVADMHFGGGRFDPTIEDKYPYLYAASTERTALAEALLRSLPFNESGIRILPRAMVKGRRISAMVVAAEMRLLALLTTTHLAAVGQDEWLVHADPPEYGKTRRWAHWLRQQAPSAHGMIWPSKRDLGEKALILFGDRCQPDHLRPASLPSYDLDDRAGTEWLKDMLADYRVTIFPPRRL